MSLRRGLAEAARRRDEQTEARALGMTWDQYIRVAGGSGRASLSESGTVDGALKRGVIYRCVNKVAGTISTFPIDVRLGRQSLPLPPVIDRPSTLWRGRSPWVHAVSSSMLLRGGAAGLVDDESMVRRGYPSWVELIDVGRVDWTSDRGWTLDGEEVDEYPNGPLWYVPLFTMPGSPLGLSPIRYAKETIYSDAVARQFSNDFFANGAHPSALLQPESDPGADGARKHKQAFKDAASGRDVAVIPQSIKYTPIQINPDDSQFIDLMKFNDEELCFFFSVDPRSIGVASSGGGNTYANREQVKQDELQDAMLQSIVRLQEAMSDLLPRPQMVRFNYAGLLRADIEARYRTYLASADYQAKTGVPIITNDEIRDLEDRPSLADVGWSPATPGGDTL